MPEITPEAVHETLHRWILADGFQLVFDLERSQGTYLYDALGERRFLDFYSFVASLPIGYNHPKMADPEFRRRLLRAALIKPSNPDIYTVEYAEFVTTFSRIAGQGMFQHYFFIDGGALAVENALKAAFDWKVRKNLQRGLAPLGQQVIHFRQAFHGRSGYTLSLTNTFDPRKTQYFPTFNWPRIINPKCVFPMNGENLDEVQRLETQALREVQDALLRNPHDIAALIIEPIQGEGGDNHFRAEFLRALREVCDEEEVLLIFDEVQTGMGATGKMWAFEHFDLRPDILAFGKKAQVCGIAVTDRIDDVDNVFRVSSRINSTFGGNLADMVRCTRYLETIEEEGLVENAHRVGAYLLEAIRKTISGNWPQITNVRGRGLLIAFDLPSSQERDRLRKIAYELGLLVPACGERSIRVRPSLTLTVEDADEGVALLETALERLYRF